MLSPSFRSLVRPLCRTKTHDLPMNDLDLPSAEQPPRAQTVSGARKKKRVLRMK